MPPLPRFVINTRKPVLRPRRWWVTLIGINGEPLSSSEMLSSPEAAATNIRAQRDAAERATVVQQSRRA